MTPLYMASQEGNIEVIELLLKYRPDINLSNEKMSSPLYIASFNGNEDVVRILLEKRADVNQCKFGNLSPLYVSLLRLFCILIRFEL
jgi:ankyrin repeat protein